MTTKCWLCMDTKFLRQPDRLKKGYSVGEPCHRCNKDERGPFRIKAEYSTFWHMGRRRFERNKMAQTNRIVERQEKQRE